MIPPIASQFIAGKNKNRAINNVEYLYENDIYPIFNYLGEHFTREEPVEETVEEYLGIIDIIHSREDESEISIKPTQLGLDIDRELFEDNLRKVVRNSSKKDVFVWVDMESPSTIEDTINTYINILNEYPDSLGLCLQANITRTDEDIEMLSNLDGVSIRIVKGAYATDHDILIKDKQKVDERYKSLITQALQDLDGRVAVGSHDEEMINHAINVDNIRANLEFQMLKGVRERKQSDLGQSYPVGQYVPYGSRWKSYTYRRIRERPKNILLIGRSVIDRIRR